ncbi:cell division protein FtsA, partial [Candidatus Sumerlaeota bacterium]|nr:cell division protein FtsA [Candidatus Sumerlaeota bacterium]
IRAHLVLAAPTAVQNLLRCVGQAGCRVNTVLLQAIASATAVLSDSEKDLGVLLLDIGGGTTDIALYSDGSIKYSGVVPCAGDSVTNDVAHFLKVSKSDAENAKKRYGFADARQVDPSETFDISGVFHSKRISVSRHKLALVVQARCEEIFDLVLQQIQTATVEPKILSGIVLTGGTSLIPGLADLAESFFKLPVKIGVPQGIGGMASVVGSPIYSTGVGLLRHGLDKQTSGAPGSGYGFRRVLKMLSSIMEF